jgi:hypothetical protein
VHLHEACVAVYLPAADYFVRVPSVDVFIPIYMVLKSSRIKSNRDRTKSWQVGEAPSGQLTSHIDNFSTHRLSTSRPTRYERMLSDSD